MAAALAAVKLGVPVVHVESGLRSRDWTMPEEINRVVTDRVSDLLLCHCQEAVENLVAEGADPDTIALVGNTMIDSLFRLLDPGHTAALLERSQLAQRGYVLVTLHRPALVDDTERLAAVLAVLGDVSRSMPVVFPVHPRTRARLAQLPRGPRDLRLIEPLDYADFLALESRAHFVITDSGGVQEETSALGVPCITYRDNTERAITVELGTNRVVGVDPAALSNACAEILEAPSPAQPKIPLWDGHAGARAAEAVEVMLDRRRPVGASTAVASL
jgi:UDP-N-acetylglucosamine 2-epimerase (non-hydrolysing)